MVSPIALPAFLPSTSPGVWQGDTYMAQIPACRELICQSKAVLSCKGGLHLQYTPVPVPMSTTFCWSRVLRVSVLLMFFLECPGVREASVPRCCRSGER